MLSRRMVLGGTVCTVLSACAAGVRGRRVSERLREIEARTAGTIGIHALDTGSGTTIGFNEHDRFAMCSTFKLPLAGAVLARVDSGSLGLDQRIRFGPENMVEYAPVTSKRLAEGAMTVRELCAAIIEVSDNPAANLLLSLIGGPAGLTRYVRSLGDGVTRLDRTETELNTNLRGDPRDTTTPSAMVRTMERLLVGEALSASSRTQLLAWLASSRTGLTRLRAGLPQRWKVGDKTGTGMQGAVNDVAICWPPDRAPILMAVYMSGSSLPTEELNAAHAGIGSVIAEALSA